MRTSLLAALLALAPAASAQEPLRRIDFAWVRGPDAARCAPRGAVLRAVRARVGHDPFDASAEVSAEVYVTRAQGLWRATLTLRDARGDVTLRRDLSDDGDGCETLTDAVVESLALALDPVAPEPAPVAEPVSVPAPAPAPPPARVPSPAPREDVSPRVRTSVSAELLAGAVPGWSPGFRWRLEASLPPRGMRLWGEMAITPERRTDAPEEHWSFGMTRAASGLCYGASPSRRFDLSACGGATLGLVHGVAHRGAPVAPGNYLWFALTAAGRAALHLHPRVALALDVEGHIALARNTFVVLGRDAPVYVQGVLALALSAGVEAAF
ncbi:MAG: hypothetical protein R3A48_05630 [Polyangiales bacterium]